MAKGTYRADDIERRVAYSGAHGNLSVAYAKVVVPATGEQNQTIDFLEMPVGTRIVDAILRNSGDTAGATTTIALGIAQKPGRKNTKVDADALITATTLSTSDKLHRRNNAAVSDDDLTLDDTYLIQGTIGAGNIGDNAVTFELWLIYENRGTP